MPLTESKTGISLYLHCRMCIAEVPEGLSPADYQRTEVGVLADGRIRIWCLRHEEEVATLRLHPETVATLGLSCEVCQ